MRLVLVAALAVLACAGAAGAGENGARIQPPLVDYRLRVLPNGLRVYSVADRTTTNVAVQVWYGVGAKNDPPGRSGLAHLLEHLMFKGTRDTPPEFIDRLTDDVGGENNASTNTDYTEFDEVIPTAHLERILWAEADRMSGLIVDQANFSSERSVVEQELREAETEDPYDKLFDSDVLRASFMLPANRRSVLGSVGDLEATGLNEVQAFHSLYYRPDNATLIVVGDFDPGRLDAWVDRYFGALARPAAPVPRPAVREPARVGHRRTDVYAPRALLPAVVLTYAGPDATSPDAAALKVLDAVLTLGRTSRLNAALVVRRQVAEEVVSDVELRQQTGLIEVGAVLADGAKMADGETALRAELAGLRRRPVTETELRAAKNQLLLELLQDRQTIDGVAGVIGEASLVRGDVGRVNAEASALQTVTAADVQRVARDYLLDERRVTIRYHAARPGSPSGASTAQGAHPSRRLAETIAPVPAAKAETTASSASRPPGPGPAVAPVQPKVFERTLANGLRIVVAHTGAQPLATASLILRGGSGLDPVGKAGLADLTASLAMDSAGGRSASEVAGSTAALGVTLSRATDYDSTTFTLSGLSTSLSSGVALLADIVRRPGFPAAQLRFARRRISGGLTNPAPSEGSICDAVVAPLVFGAGPYGRAANGDLRTLATIGLAQVVGEHARLYRPDNAILVLAGDVDGPTAFALAERVFGNWRPPVGPPPALPANGAAPPGAIVVVDLPGSEQATVMLAAPSIGRLDPSYGAVEVANALLGGTLSSRLGAEIRVKRGLTYDASSEVDGFQGGGLFKATAQTSNARAAEVAGLMLAQLDALRQRPPTADELAARKAHLIGDFGRDMETGEDLAGRLAMEAFYRAGVVDLGRYPAGIAAVTADQARAAVARLADRARTSVLVAGDASRFLPAMRARFGNVEVLRARSLTLDSLERLRGRGVDRRPGRGRQAF